MAASTELDIETEGQEEDDDEALLETQRAPGPLWASPRALVGLLLSDRYRLLEVIGQGGMGAVYLAEHVVIEKRIAVKVLSPEYSRNPGDVQRFLQEARTASLVRHDHIVDISDFGYTPRGQAFLVMELLEGEDLAHLLAREGRLPWFRATNVVLQIGSALSAAHAKGVVHRDMKPENCFMVRRPDGEDFVKVLDFGIAKITDERLKRRGSSLTIDGGIVGTPEYIAPELVRGQKADLRVDIYALGVVMYRLLTGTLPFVTEGENYMALLSAHLTEPPQPPRERAPEAQIPAEIERVVLRALEKDPGVRFQTVEEMIAAIREAQLLLTGSSSTGFITKLPVIVPRTLRAPRRGRRRWLVAAGAAGAAIGALALWLALQGGKDRAEESGAKGHLPPAGAAGGQEAKAAPEMKAAPEPEVPPEPEVLPPLEPEDEPPDARGAGLSEAQFGRVVAEIQAAVKARCSGLPGMQIRAKIYVGADGKVSRVAPEGPQAGSSFGTCVVKQIRAARFPRAGKPTTRTATFKL